jgi:thermostable 8-oxoguanine DNA glycosylase
VFLHCICNALNLFAHRFHLSRFMYVFVFRKQVHVPEAVNGNEGKVRLALAQVVKGMGKLDAVGDEEIYVF